jgi:alkanesulfonate monooxygenase SsuD/methylene tetrahydromethanopterin reductase-like flavin-dependent oxidoreductase (luciferase family)
MSPQQLRRTGRIHGVPRRPEARRATAAAEDAEVARRLWDVSEELTGVRFPLGTPAVESALTQS